MCLWRSNVAYGNTARDWLINLCCIRRNSKPVVIMGLATIEELHAELRNDTRVKVAGIDADGVMRGKIMDRDKFLSAARSGFGFCRLRHIKSHAKVSASYLVGTSMTRCAMQTNVLKLTKNSYTPGNFSFRMRRTVRCRRLTRSLEGIWISRQI